MKRIALIIIGLVFFSTSPAICQLNWAPVGAIWHYDAFEGCEGGCNTGYLTIEVIKDSIVGDTILSKLEIIRHGKNGGDWSHGFAYTL
jgi:hypothetical protein